MQIKSIVLSVAALVSVVCAYPASYDDAAENLFRRTGTLHCVNHNYNIVCATTHECVGGVVTHIPGTYTGNSWCTDGRRCKCI
ncbi:hypothetical protein HYPSUDRAFT_38028 [Hypholoma sublateritium FD-334 SS-4]|uniref:Uncharacterized protein n=1 Tax=Hypholoma sublateritium (strain FD-334 SS-4) TaxID=945553 RepID=A0A0D2P2C3_HYPSF|nr:hypothetical protein HYPSUDRAFT_38028 [Hypholoma sublateritium FD-334 SS-4]